MKTRSWQWYIWGKSMVLRTDDVEETRRFFEKMMGVTFKKEKHGTGPEHYAVERDGSVFEIYPEYGSVAK